MFYFKQQKNIKENSNFIISLLLIIPVGIRKCFIAAIQSVTLQYVCLSNAHTYQAVIFGRMLEKLFF